MRSDYTRFDIILIGPKINRDTIIRKTARFKDMVLGDSDQTLYRYQDSNGYSPPKCLAELKEIWLDEIFQEAVQRGGEYALHDNLR